MTTQQQTERERLALVNEWDRAVGLNQSREVLAEIGNALRNQVNRALRGDEPAKSDRYVEIAREFLAAWDPTLSMPDRVFQRSFQAAAAVLRKHFGEKPCQNCGFLPDSTG